MAVFDIILYVLILLNHYSQFQWWYALIAHVVKSNYHMMMTTRVPLVNGHVYR
jgi:hypothetical protein